MKTEIKEKLINLTLFFTVFLFLIVFFELGCRVLYDESENYDRYVEIMIENGKKNGFSRANDKYVNPENGLKYYRETNKVSEQYFLSDKRITKKEKESDKYRVAVLGDSFTMGGGLPGYYSNKNVYTKQLAALLNRHEDEFEVLTFAEGGVNTYQELVLLRELVLDYNPDMVILQYCDNDVGPNRSELGYSDSGLYINSKTEILFIDDHVVPAFSFLNRDLNTKLLKYSSFLRFISYKLNIVLQKNTIYNENTESSFNALTEIDEILSEKEIPFLVINFPLAYIDKNYCSDDVFGYGGTKLHEKLKKHLEALEVPFYNMCDYVNDIRDIKSKHSDEGDCHYGEEGYALAANILHKAIVEMSGIGSTTVELDIEDVQIRNDH